MDNRELFEAWVRSSPDLVGQLDYYFSSMDAKFVIWKACAEKNDKEIADLKTAIEVSRQLISNKDKELQELKDEINRVWYLAYPQSPLDERDTTKMRIFNIYQDLKCTRDNYKSLHIEYNKMDAERKK